eukprot:300237-Alexandrium_andersonii.AAC.1
MSLASALTSAMPLALGPESAKAVLLRLLREDTDVCCACLQTPASQALRVLACLSGVTLKLLPEL